MCIFKYTKHAKDTLQKRELRMSHPGELNDPFELSPAFDIATFNPARIKDYLSRESTIQAEYLDHGGGVPYGKFKKKYRAALSARIALALNKIPKRVEEVRAKFAETFSKYFLLCCASKRKTSILMWSHYADNHRGCVLEFETDEEPFLDLQEFTFDVVYTDKKGNFDFVPGLPRDIIAKMLIDVAKRKSPEWEYEDEMRVIFPENGSLDQRITPACLRSITFGCRCPTSEVEEITKILSAPDWKHVSMEQAKLNQDEFKLDFVKLR